MIITPKTKPRLNLTIPTRIAEACRRTVMYDKCVVWHGAWVIRSVF